MKTVDPVKTGRAPRIQDLVRHQSGRYYVWLSANGKQSWKSLGTDFLEVANAKLRDLRGRAQQIVRA